LCINAAIALRTGNAQQFTAALTGGLPAAAGEAAVSPGMLLLGLSDGGSSAGVQQVLLLLLFAAASPAGERVYRAKPCSHTHVLLRPPLLVSVCSSAYDRTATQHPHASIVWGS
jgi:hypothetical protein